jgi:hypothetical protein
MDPSAALQNGPLPGYLDVDSLSPAGSRETLRSRPKFGVPAKILGHSLRPAERVRRQFLSLRQTTRFSVAF